MSKNPKPRCRYNCFKYCPEKPFYIREEYPFGNIVSCDEGGCDFWWIDLVHKNGIQSPPAQYGMCIDKWNAFYARDTIQRMTGNQQATEMLRNGLCIEVEKITADGKTMGSYLPKPSQETFFLIDVMKKIYIKNQQLENKIKENEKI